MGFIETKRRELASFVAEMQEKIAAIDARLAETKFLERHGRLKSLRASLHERWKSGQIPSKDFATFLLKVQTAMPTTRQIVGQTTLAIRRLRHRKYRRKKNREEERRASHQAQENHRRLLRVSDIKRARNIRRKKKKAILAARARAESPASKVRFFAQRSEFTSLFLLQSSMW